jgi:CRP/FNR family transcriptional regulator
MNIGQIVTNSFVNPQAIKVACSNCNLKELCMPIGLSLGELERIDEIVADRRTCDAVALEDAEVCVMPFDRIEELSREVTSSQRHVHKIMSREIITQHGVRLLLESMRAEARLATFFLNLVQRLHTRGFFQSKAYN